MFDGDGCGSVDKDRVYMEGFFFYSGKVVFFYRMLYLFMEQSFIVLLCYCQKFGDGVLGYIMKCLKLIFVFVGLVDVLRNGNVIEV